MKTDLFDWQRHVAQTGGPGWLCLEQQGRRSHDVSSGINKEKMKDEKWGAQI